MDKVKVACLFARLVKCWHEGVWNAKTIWGECNGKLPSPWLIARKEK